MMLARGDLRTMPVSGDDGDGQARVLALVGLILL
jgi:hypothetical protein